MDFLAAKSGLARGYGLRVWRDQWAPHEERLRAIECLDMVGLADLANRRAGELSGGQSQRVAIARCLMQDPGIILADEPAASLDPSAGEEVMEMFHRLSRDRGITLVVVSHDMEHAQRFSDRIIGLKDGGIVLDGPSSTFSIDQLRGFFA
ncbi:MAG: ATP-binding cassette domain-containing protein [Planctomycetota bacterium]|nr:MAG: ATP-binding cassette domain-containing protein [Planctomycetota bacterium]